MTRPRWLSPSQWWIRPPPTRRSKQRRNVAFGACALVAHGIHSVVVSVIAGVSLFDGVLLASDARVTVLRRGQPDVYLDCAQKLFPISSHAVIGFVGNVDVASLLLREMFRQLPGRKRKDVVSLMLWISRLFRRRYGDRVGAEDCSAQVTFMLGAVLADRPNVVERESIVRVMNQIAFGQPAIQRNWIPDILVRSLQSPPSVKYVRFTDLPLSTLWVMAAPKFELRRIPPLQFAAIGSGSPATVKIADYHDMIVAGEPGNSFIEAMTLRHAINDYISESDIKTVGGLLPVAKITGNGVEALGYGLEMPEDEIEIRLSFDSRAHRWIQKNVKTGKEITLLYPWEIPFDETKGKVFDDFLEAYRRFRGER